MDLKLKDKVILVTGGTGGIGSAVVKGFLAEGAKVAFSSTSQSKIDALIPTLNAAEGQVAGFIKHERENPGFQSGDESEFLVPPYVFVV